MPCQGGIHLLLIITILQSFFILYLWSVSEYNPTLSIKEFLSYQVTIQNIVLAINAKWPQNTTKLNNIHSAGQHKATLEGGRS